MDKSEQVKVSTYLSKEQAEKLKALSDRTRVPQAAYFREAVEDLLKKHEAAAKSSGKASRGGE